MKIYSRTKTIIHNIAKAVRCCDVDTIKENILSKFAQYRGPFRVLNVRKDVSTFLELLNAVKNRRKLLIHHMLPKDAAKLVCKLIGLVHEKVAKDDIDVVLSELI